MGDRWRGHSVAWAAPSFLALGLMQLPPFKRRRLQRPPPSWVFIDRTKSEISRIGIGCFKRHIGCRRVGCANCLNPKCFCRPALRAGIFLKIVPLVQDQSHEEVAGVTGVREESRHQFLAVEFSVRKPFKGLPFDSGQIVLE